MTDEWQSLTHRFAISGHKGYVTVATDEHGRPVPLEIRMAKAGGVLRGLLDSLAASVSLGLQSGVPLSAYVERLALARFARAGWTHGELGCAHSVVDYLFHWLVLRFPAASAVAAGAPPQFPTVRPARSGGTLSLGAKAHRTRTSATSGYPLPLHCRLLLPRSDGL